MDAPSGRYILDQGFVIWLTGLSQSGKTTVSLGLEKLLKEAGIKTERLDGDVVRQSLCKDLGFTSQDRNKNIERVTYVAKLLSRNKIAVLVAFISPYRLHRLNARQELTNFIEVYVNCPLETCEARDKKGLYHKARRREIDNFTGISDAYEVPDNPDIEIRTDKMEPDDCVKVIRDYLLSNSYLRTEAEAVAAGG